MHVLPLKCAKIERMAHTFVKDCCFFVLTVCSRFFVTVRLYGVRYQQRSNLSPVYEPLIPLFSACTSAKL